MSEDLLPELFKQPNADFLQHLAIENNERIIFSGKFGHGKTTFINHFFEEEIQKKNNDGKVTYNVISLYPVNYSIASNEDIFKYIKYDIILDMLNRRYDVKKTAASYFKTLPKFLKKNLHKVLASLVYMIPNVGKELVESFEKLDKLKSEFLKYHDEENENGSDLLADYLDKLETSEGNIFEDDVITKLITQVLQKKKEEVGPEAENVLVIDDLDRIDPEHIFRILNVFAAHFDRRSVLQTKNKFGFDKIILVCDIENIRNIFRAKYGIDTDFNGYIDKFYSKRIFHFNNSKAISNLGQRLFWDVKWNGLGFYGRGAKEDIEVGKTIPFKRENASFLIDMLSLLFSSGQIDLRNILKMRELPMPYVDNLILKEKYFNEEEHRILLFLRLLALIKGDHHSLKEAFRNTYKNLLNANKIREYSKDIISVIVLATRVGNPDNATYRFKMINKNLSLVLTTENFQQKVELYEDVNTKTIPNITDEEFIWLLLYTIDFLASQNHFNY